MTGQNFVGESTLGNCAVALNQRDSKMNQTCKVCGEPAAGFHFGAFTCEGCKSFFGRSYNNINSINDCKNNNKCVINKKNRTACKACRLRKCVMVGMSKSGSRYGRRSNWFKIHCLLQEQQQKQLQENGEEQNGTELMPPQMTPPPNSHQPMSMRLLGTNPFTPPLLHLPRTREELMLLGLDETFRHPVSPSVSSPESHNSDSSVEIPDARRIPLIPGLLPPTFMPPPGLLFPPGYPPFYHGLLQTSPHHVNHSHTNNNNNTEMRTNNPVMEAQVKREYLDAVLQLQRTSTPSEDQMEDEEVDVKTPVPTPSLSPVQDTPIDLSMRTMSERGSSSPTQSERSGVSARTSERGNASEGDEESDCDSENRGLGRIGLARPTPLDLTTKV